jgi:DNA-binding NtrC family response regulator
MAHSVLLVDDDPDVLCGLERVLRREPYAIRVAEHPAAAFQILARHPTDVVVSDEAMPGMSGTAFLARVQHEYPDTVRLILTGQASLEVAVRAINEGHVYRFFTKPCNPVELSVAIRQALQHRALLVESRRLLDTFRRQSAVMEELEHEVRGLTRVERDASGAVVVRDAPTDLEALLDEVQEELRAADERLRERERRIRRRVEQTQREIERLRAEAD